LVLYHFGPKLNLLLSTVNVKNTNTCKNLQGLETKMICLHLWDQSYMGSKWHLTFISHKIWVRKQHNGNFWKGFSWKNFRFVKKDFPRWNEEWQKNSWKVEIAFWQLFTIPRNFFISQYCSRIEKRTNENKVLSFFTRK
jgi:hypothetical protein